ncbi:MAG: hypothetical protein BGO55_09490 [Sphingobacteriales bacterium 50-39]|nr:MAG: hypothetical protein BGO55_09490 [Sphingobacteriales bacterium 50-39]
MYPNSLATVKVFTKLYDLPLIGPKVPGRSHQSDHRSSAALFRISRKFADGYIKSLKFSSGLDLNIHTGRQIQLGQRIYRPRRGSINVQQALVRMQLELLTSLLVYVRRTQYSKDLFAGWQGNWSRYHSTRTTNGFNDLFSRFIYQIVIVGL